MLHDLSAVLRFSIPGQRERGMGLSGFSGPSTPYIAFVLALPLAHGVQPGLRGLIIAWGSDRSGH